MRRRFELLSQRIEKFLLPRGKLIGWDKSRRRLAPEAPVMSWRGTDGGIAAAKQHHAVVMSPYEYVYLYCYQAAEHPLAPSGTYLAERYTHSIPCRALSASEQKYILVGGLLLSEFVCVRRARAHVIPDV